MGKGKVAGKIKGMAGAWNQARKDVGEGFGDFVPVDKGSYHMQLVKAEIGDFGDERKLMHKWCVVANDDGNNGKICTDFEGIDDPDRLVWLMRMLQALGVDLDECEVDTEDDLIAIFNDLIAERTVAKVRVTEKGGYTNMRVQKVVEIDDGDLVDPDEVFASSGRDSQSDDDDDDDDGDDGDEHSFSAGDEVTWTSKSGKARSGKIESVDDEEETAVVIPDGKKKGVTVDLDDLTPVAGDDEDEDDDKDDDEPEAKEPEPDGDEDEVSIGDEVLAPVGSKGKTRKGKVVKVSKKAGTCDVKFDTPTKKGTTHAKGVKLDDLEHVIDDDDDE